MHLKKKKKKIFSIPIDSNQITIFSFSPTLYLGSSVCVVQLYLSSIWININVHQMDVDLIESPRKIEVMFHDACRGYGRLTVQCL